MTAGGDGDVIEAILARQDAARRRSATARRDEQAILAAWNRHTPMQGLEGSGANGRREVGILADSALHEIAWSRPGSDLAPPPGILAKDSDDGASDGSDGGDAGAPSGSATDPDSTDDKSGGAGAAAEYEVTVESGKGGKKGPHGGDAQPCIQIDGGPCVGVGVVEVSTDGGGDDGGGDDGSGGEDGGGVGGTVTGSMPAPIPLPPRLIPQPPAIPKPFDPAVPWEVVIWLLPLFDINDTPEDYDSCLEKYVDCTEFNPNYDCGTCFTYCLANNKWPKHLCP